MAVQFRERGGDAPYEEVTRGVTRQKKGKGRRVCDKLEAWYGERVAPFSWSGPNIPDNVFDARVWKRTRWLLPSGELFDEEMDVLVPWNKGNNQDTVRITFVAGRECALHRAIAFLFANRRHRCGRYLSWAEFNKKLADGNNAYEVDHDDDKHWNSVVQNLVVLTRREHMRKDGRRP